MRAVIQRVSKASVSVAGEVVGQIENGLLVFLGVQLDDTQMDVDYIVKKSVGLRVFEDKDGRMNLDVTASRGSVLAISQFTLLGDVRRGKRPSFTAAEEPVEAQQLYEAYCRSVAEQGVRVEQGVFQADMQVALVNDGPVTIMLDSRKTF